MLGRGAGGHLAQENAKEQANTSTATLDRHVLCDDDESDIGLACAAARVTSAGE